MSIMRADLFLQIASFFLFSNHTDFVATRGVQEGVHTRNLNCSLVVCTPVHSTISWPVTMNLFLNVEQCFMFDYCGMLVVAMAVSQYADMVVGKPLLSIFSNFGDFWQQMVHEPQLRWVSYK